MIKRLFNRQINSVTTAAFLVAIASLFSRILGIFRDHILSGTFGGGDILDAYFAAFRIPDMIFNLLVLGALSAGFIPIFTGLINKENKKNREAWKLASGILNLLMIVLVGLSVLGMIFTPALIRLIAPGFSPELQSMTTELTRMMFLSPIFLGISSVLGGILQSFKRFLVYSLAPILYNLGIIVGVIYLVPVFGINGLAFGVILGAVLHMLIQLPTVLRLGFKYSLDIDWKSSNLRKIGMMMIPRTLSLGITQINLVVITIIASGLDSGSLTVFNLANNLQFFPIGIFGISFAIAVFPVLSSVAFNEKKLVRNFSNTVRQILFFIIPSTALLLILRAQIIRVLYGTGNFDWYDTIRTIDVLGFFALSLFAQALIPLLTRTFYARHNSSTPFFIALFSIVVNIFLSISLSKSMGVSGLALAFSISSILNFALLWITLRIEIGNLDQVRILRSVIKFSAAALIAGVVTQEMKMVIWPYVDMTRYVGVLVQGLVAGISGISVYVLLCYLFKSEELNQFIRVFKRRISVKKVNTDDQGEARGI